MPDNSQDLLFALGLMFIVKLPLNKYHTMIFAGFIVVLL